MSKRASTKITVAGARAEGKTPIFQIDVAAGDTEPFSVQRTPADLAKFAKEIAKAYAAKPQIQFTEFPAFETSGAMDEESRCR